MKERISKLASGIVEYEKPQVELSLYTIEERVPAARSIRGEVRIESVNQVPLKGLIYSTDHRLELSRSQFFGTRAVLEYGIEARYVTRDFDMRGEIHLVYNGGELCIPYYFSVEAASAGMEEVELQTLEDFADYAKECFEEAKVLFCSSGFLDLPFMQSLSLRNLYDGLRSRGHLSIAFEEFLTGSGVKEPVKVSIEDKQKSYQMPELGFEDQIKITRNTWGHVEVSVSTDADFIKLSKDRITGEDFAGDEASFGFFVDGSKLHGGINLGQLLFTTPFQQFTVEISARLSGHRQGTYKSHVEFQRHLVNFTSLYIDYHAGAKESRLLLNEMTAEMSRLRSAFPTSDLLELLHAELFVLQDKKEQAFLLLEDVRERVQENRQEDVDTYCVYLYVKYLIEGGESQRASLIAILEKYAGSKQGSYLPFLLQMRLDERFEENPAFCIKRLKELKEQGANTPYLYMAACRLYQENENLLKKLNAFEKQTLLFGARKGMLSEETALCVARLSASEKKFDGKFLRLLTKLYEQYPKREILEAVCSLLIRGDLRDGRYFTWFERGVEEDLRLTKLYEYYLYTMPLNTKKELPQSVLMYFSYHHGLDYHARAILYHYILLHCAADSPLYESYKEQMETFALEQLFAGHVDEFLLKLYQTIFYKEMIDVKVANRLLPCLYTCRITCSLPYVTHVAVSYEALKDEQIYPICEGSALVPLYSDHVNIFFQDMAGNRYAATHGSASRPLIWQKELAEECQKVIVPPLPLRAEACRELLKEGGLDSQGVAFVENLLGEENIHDLFRARVLPGLFAFYESGREMEKNDGGLLRIREESLSKEDKIRYIELLVQRSYFEEAYDLIKRYGYQGMKISRLFQLASRMILQRLYEKDSFLLQLAYYVFIEEKFDNVVLEYLCHHFNGTCDEMYQIFTTAVRSRVETYDMEERLLAQLMYVDRRDYMDEVFKAYVNRKTADALILNAYLALKCYAYFLGELPMDPEVFAYIEEGSMSQELRYSSLITMLAITRFYSENVTLSEKQKEYAERLLDVLETRGMLFSYFQTLAQKAGLYYDFCDKTIIEYHGKKGSRLKLATRIVPGQEQFTVVEFPCRYEGIFVKAVSVFADEKLEYKILEQIGEVPEVLKEGTCSQYVFGGQLNGRFAMLNQLIHNDEEVSQDTRLEQMEEYGMKDAMVEKVFQLL